MGANMMLNAKARYSPIRFVSFPVVMSSSAKKSRTIIRRIPANNTSFLMRQLYQNGLFTRRGDVDQPALYLDKV